MLMKGFGRLGDEFRNRKYRVNRLGVSMSARESDVVVRVYVGRETHSVAGRRRGGTSKNRLEPFPHLTVAAAAAKHAPHHNT